MKALLLNKPKNIEIKELEKPEIKADEVLVNIKINGLCTNDIRDYVGNSVYTYPRIGGHEFSGEIVEVGSEVNPELFAVGDRVVKYIIPACGECHYCKINRENLCNYVYNSTTFQNENGISGFLGMQEYLAVKSKDLYKYPKDTSFITMAFTEPLACSINSINRANLEFGQDVLIMGGGVMGLLHVMLAKLKGVSVIVSEPNDERRQLAEKLGADLTIDPTEDKSIEKVKNYTEGRGADVVFNTTSNPAFIDQALEFTAKGGQTYLFSSIHPNEPVETDMGIIHAQEKVITGTVSPTIDTFYQAVRLLSKDMINIEPLIGKVFHYTDVEEAYLYAAKPETFKTLISFE